VFKGLEYVSGVHVPDTDVVIVSATCNILAFLQEANREGKVCMGVDGIII
jgi:hypothetical protein